MSSATQCEDVSTDDFLSVIYPYLKGKYGGTDQKISLDEKLLQLINLITLLKDKKEMNLFLFNSTNLNKPFLHLMKLN